MLVRNSIVRWAVAALASFGFIVLVLPARTLEAATPVETAQAILAESGIRGGLVVHLGCGDGELTAQLRAGEGFLVHGLDRDEAAVARARRHIRSLGLYGPVAVEPFDGQRLPYTDNLVNLLVIEDPDAVSAGQWDRVLAPEGVAMVRRGDVWEKTVKPRPADIGRWTHYLHGPDNNAVVEDAVVGPPVHLQWVADPVWARSHEHLASITAMVTCGRRVFFIVDEGPTALAALDPDWQLVARDAFSGVLLWKRPVGLWEGHLRGFRSGPTELTRRLVTAEDRLLVTLGYGQPVTSLDPATGETLHVYEPTADALEILHADGVLYVVTGELEDEADADAVRRRGAVPPPRNRRLLAVEAESGKVLWEKSDADTTELMPVTLAVADGAVYFQNPLAIVCLDAASGEPRWQAERPVSVQRPAWSTPTLVVHDGVVISADRQAAPTAQEAQRDQVDWIVSSRGGQAPEGEMIALAADTGQRLWSAACREVYNAPVDVLVVDGLVWSGYLVFAKEPGITAARDLHTGKIVRQRPRDQEFFRVGFSHHRCYRNKATSRYLVLGRSGVELIDVQTGEGLADHWVRGTCQYGVMPANGMIYAPSHSCACYIEAKLNGFNALAPRRQPAVDHASQTDPPDHPNAANARHQRGPAFGQPVVAAPQPGQWPTYRGDAARSGTAAMPVATRLRPDWQTELGGGPLSAVVVAEGKLLVAQIDLHTVHALDAGSGEPQWSFTAGGRVDSPPTVHDGRVLFGSADGWIYCLRAADGQLIWRFRAAPEDRRIVAYDQLESAWPVHGNVLVQGGVAYAAAGRSSYIDGGMRLVRLDPATGKLLSETVLDDRDPQTGRQPKEIISGVYMPGHLPDVLSSDGQSVFMRHSRFDLEGTEIDQRVPHLFSPAGFLDDSWWHRTYWMYGTEMGVGWGSWANIGNRLPVGRLLVHDGETMFGFGRTVYARHGSHVGLPQEILEETWPLEERRPTHYRLFAAPLPSMTAEEATAAARKGRRTGEPPEPGTAHQWTQPLPLWVRAMVLAERTLLLAGPPDVLAADDPTAAWGGRRGGMLRVLATDDGSTLAEYELPAPPVFDGMAAAAGRLYLATVDGRVVSWAEQP
jgi:outer membrane protein assembly factor BamB